MENDAEITSPGLDWTKLPREYVRRGVERAGFRGDDVICVFNWLTPGMETRPHRHAFEQLAFVLEGRVRMHIGDSYTDMGAGSMVRIPPNEIHYAEPLGNKIAVNLDIFAPIREDYLHLVEYQKGQFGAPDPGPKR